MEQAISYNRILNALNGKPKYYKRQLEKDKIYDPLMITSMEEAPADTLNIDFYRHILSDLMKYKNKKYSLDLNIVKVSFICRCDYYLYFSNQNSYKNLNKALIMIYFREVVPLPKTSKVRFLRSIYDLYAFDL